MTILEIPVTPFSRRILEAEHEHLLSNDAKILTLLKVAHSDILYHQLGNRRITEHLSTERLQKELSERVHLYIHESLADETHRNCWHTGHYLNLLHRTRLNEALWWECRGLGLRSEKCQLQAKQVIEAFCNHFNIELDVDISYGTLYRSWTRFRQCREQNDKNERRLQLFSKKNTSFLEKKNTRLVRQKQRKNSTHKAENAVPYLNSELDSIVQNYIIKNPAVFLTQRNKERTIRLKQLRCYVFHLIGKRKLRDLQDVLGLPEKSIHTAATAFSEVLLSAPPIEVPPTFTPYNKV